MIICCALVILNLNWWNEFNNLIIFYNIFPNRIERDRKKKREKKNQEPKTRSLA